MNKENILKLANVIENHGIDSYKLYYPEFDTEEYVEIERVTDRIDLFQESLKPIMFVKQ